VFGLERGVNGNRNKASQGVSIGYWFLFLLVYVLGGSIELARSLLLYTVADANAWNYLSVVSTMGPFSAREKLE